MQYTIVAHNLPGKLIYTGQLVAAAVALGDTVMEVYHFFKERRNNHQNIRGTTRGSRLAQDEKK